MFRLILTPTISLLEDQVVLAPSLGLLLILLFCTRKRNNSTKVITALGNMKIDAKLQVFLLLTKFIFSAQFSGESDGT